jgi:hypothetical protein
MAEKATLWKRLLSQKKWLWLVVAPVALLLVCYAVLVVVGMWRGEHFYAGRPTSYWRATLKVSSWYDNAPLGQRLSHFAGRFLDRPLYPRVKSGSAAALPVLLDLLRDPDPDVRFEVVSTLGFYGPRTDVAVAALEQALTDPEEDVRHTAAHCLGEFVRESAVAREAVCRALKSDDAALHQLVLNGLPESGPESQEVVAALGDALSEEDLRYLAEKAQALQPDASLSRRASGERARPAGA